MPRPRVIRVAPPVTHGEAAYVLERLVADRRITPSDVQRYVAAMHTDIVDLEYRLHSLRSAAAGSLASQSTPPRIGASASATTPRRRRRPRKPASAEVKASQQLQGQYVSLICQIAKYKRAQYQKIAKERGREAAVAEMRAVLHK